MPYVDCSCLQLSSCGFAGWRAIGGAGRPFPEGDGRILENIGFPWGHQVAVLFQIVCALVSEVPSVLLDHEILHGLSPNVTLACEPWGHMDHGGGGCECLSSNSTRAYVHDLSPASCGRDSSPVTEEALTAGARDEDSSFRGVDLS